MTVGPCFSYYGGKWRIARKYPPPRHATIIEPFAGSAGYAAHYEDRQVILYEQSLKVYLALAYLIQTPPDEILRLPLLAPGESLRDHPELSDGALAFIGFWVGGATTVGGLTLPKWARDYGDAGDWGARCRARAARTAARVKHWQVHHGAYTDAPDVAATWFIDPPYQGPPGRHYHQPPLDYRALGAWCRARRGQVIVCEGAGADWLPFVPLCHTKGAVRQTQEVWWHNQHLRRLPFA